MIRAFVAAALLVAATGAATAAQDGDRAQQETQAAQRLEALRTQIRAITAEQREHADEKAAATTALRDADAEVSTAVRTLRATEAEIATSEAGLVELQQQKATLESGLTTQRVALARLVRSAYALGRHEQLKLLLAQDRVSDLARVLAYHRYFQADRAERIEGLLAELQQLADVVRAIDAERSGLETARVRQQAELATLETRRDERRTLLAQLEAGFRDRSARLVALGRDEQAFVKLLERLRDAVADIPREVDDSRPFASRRGQLPPPLVGTRLAGFGGQLPDGRGSDGLLIAGTAGAEVRAVAPGRVAYSDWLKGYGLLTIVDHGDGWMSLYAFNDALLKDVGDWVRAGDPLATVGSSGGQGRAALYFELRRDGQPQDPKPWLR